MHVPIEKSLNSAYTDIMELLFRKINLKNQQSVVLRTSLAIQILAMVFFWCFAIGITYVSFIIKDLSPKTPDLVKYFMMFLGMAMSFIVIQPRNYHPWVAFFADKEGLYIPEDSVVDIRKEWIFIPWEDVIEMETKKLIGSKGKDGIVFKIRMTEENKNKYFKNALLSQKFWDMLLNNEERPKDIFLLGMTTGFEKAEKFLRKLEILRS